jgi:molecular chaperone GrpE
MTTGHTDGTPPDAHVPDGPPGDETVSGAAAAQDVETLTAELNDIKAKYLRAVADYQNLRRRSEEERREYGRYTLAALVINYLPVLDDLDRAIESVDADIAERQWVEGVRMVQRKFRGVLEGSGVRAIEAEGAAFNPELHEALSYAPGPEGQVIAVVQPGYTLDGKVVRPAQVVVGNGAPGAAAPGEDPSSPADAAADTTTDD